jgi:hypothetical protein
LNETDTNLLFRLDGLVRVLERHVEKQGLLRRVTLDDTDGLEAKKA